MKRRMPLLIDLLCGTDSTRRAGPIPAFFMPSGWFRLEAARQFWRAGPALDIPESMSSLRRDSHGSMEMLLIHKARTATRLRLLSAR